MMILIKLSRRFFFVILFLKNLKKITKAYKKTREKTLLPLNLQTQNSRKQNQVK
jgi:hypothetical protein